MPILPPEERLLPEEPTHTDARNRLLTLADRLEALIDREPSPLGSPQRLGQRGRLRMGRLLIVSAATRMAGVANSWPHGPSDRTNIEDDEIASMVLAPLHTATESHIFDITAEPHGGEDGLAMPQVAASWRARVTARKRNSTDERAAVDLVDLSTEVLTVAACNEWARGACAFSRAARALNGGERITKALPYREIIEANARAAMVGRILDAITRKERPSDREIADWARAALDDWCAEVPWVDRLRMMVANEVGRRKSDISTPVVRAITLATVRYAAGVVGDKPRRVAVTLTDGLLLAALAESAADSEIAPYVLFGIDEDGAVVSVALRDLGVALTRHLTLLRERDALRRTARMATEWLAGIECAYTGLTDLEN